MNFDELEFEKDRVAESIVEDLKNGIISWHDRTSRFVPSNPASNIFYTGVNRFLLYGISKEKGYDIPYFCTQKQAEEKGWSIKDGQQPETLVMIKEYENKKVKKVVDGVEKVVTEKVKLHEREIKEFQVYNISQLDNVDIKEHKFPDDLLDRMGELLEVNNLVSDDFTDKKEYAFACIHAAVSQIYKDSNNYNSLKADLTESFICNSLGIDFDVRKECPATEWAVEIENNKSEFLNTLSIAENTAKKVMDVYKDNIDRVEREKALEGVNVLELYEDIARDLQKLYVFNNQYFSHEDILNSLQNKDTRKQVMGSLLKKYSKNKYRTHVRDLILIGKVVSSLSMTEPTDNQKYVNEIEKEINIIEKSVSVDFGKDFEKHPYNLAVSISNAATGILNMSKEEIFDKLKDHDGRTEIMDSISKVYMDKLQSVSKQSDEMNDLKAIKCVIKEIAALENPDLVKNKDNVKKQSDFVRRNRGKKR